MGFFCYRCNKKVRGQPVNHGCTRKKFGKNANRRVYDQSGGKSHRLPPSAKGYICFHLRDTGVCSKGTKCGFSHSKKVKDAISNPPCKDFVSTGYCKNFKKCPFSHPRARKGLGIDDGVIGDNEQEGV